MNLSLISVIVPCYNERAYIENCLISILNQSIPAEKMEIIVVDGMSDDGTRDILKDMQLKYGRFEILNNIKRKTPFARNTGLKASHGDFIAILDAHSVYDRDYLLNSLMLFDKHKDIVCAGGPIESKGINSFGQAVAAAMSHPLGVGNAKHRFPDYEGFAEGACFPVFKKEVFNTVGNFDEKFIRNQDDEFNLRIKNNGMKIFLSPAAKCTYYVRETPAALFKQYFEYGFWRVAVIKKHKIPMSLRQIVPLLFLLILLISIIISPFIKINPVLTIFTIPFIYVIILMIAAIPVIIKKGFSAGILFPFAAIILHFSYALGFIKGIFSKFH